MRLWSIHPKYLDRMGLLALWRESLLAQAVIANKTKGYKNHPQIKRFLLTENPLFYIGTYLITIAEEGERRGYSFDRSKILFYYEEIDNVRRICVKNGQISYEFNHLLNKLRQRDMVKFKEIIVVKNPEINKLFEVVEGPVEDWEKIK